MQIKCSGQATCGWVQFQAFEAPYVYFFVTKAPKKFKLHQKINGENSAKRAFSLQNTFKIWKNLLLLFSLQNIQIYV